MLKVNLLRRVYEIFAYYFAVLVFFFASFLINLLSLICLILPGNRWLAKPLRLILQSLFIFWANFVGWIGILKLKTPPKTEMRTSDGSVWVMNHPTILDGSYLLKFITNGTCIYKHAIYANPFYGCTARLANYIPNVGGPDLIRLAVASLRRGEDVAIFPEGTRSTRMNISNFKPGFALISKRANAPIHVLKTDNPPNFMTREVNVWKVPSLPIHVNISLLETINPHPNETVDELMNRVIDVYENEMISVAKL